MTTPLTAKFASAARVLSQHLASQGLVTPGFRSPPRTIGLDRAIRRTTDGTGGIVAVRVAGRPFTASIADMIEGVIVLNALVAPEADRLRAEVWRVMLSFTVQTQTTSQAGDVGERTVSRVA